MVCMCLFHVLCQFSHCFSVFFPVDIDECVTGKHQCPYSRECVNTFGSYYCKCRAGYDLKYINGKYDCIGNKLRAASLHVKHNFYFVSYSVVVNLQIRMSVWSTLTNAADKQSV